MNQLAIKISDAEADIMRVLWENDKPVTYSHIRKTLIAKDSGWDSSTINTLVNRLVKKGILNQMKKDVFYYTPTVSQEEYMELKTKTFLHKIYKGNVKNLLSALVNYDEVTYEDLTELKKFLKQGGNGDD